MRSNKKKKRIWAACLCLVFAVTTALGLLALPVKSYAEDANAEIDTLKFKQVAAGEDFAIALTYNGDLYGWSLTKAETDNNFNDSATTLGGYYPAKPHRIDVEKTYITYTLSSSEYVVNASGVKKNEMSSEQVHSGGEGDEIIQIAATRTTAAFLTEQGIIYTWGKDNDVEPATTVKAIAPGVTNKLNLLRRNSVNKYKPVMIDYTAHEDFRVIAPIVSVTDNLVTSRVKSLSASEYNYIAYYDTNGSNNASKNFVWGQTVYNQLHQMTGTHNFAPAADKRWQSNFEGGKGKVYIGDGNAYYIDNAGLHVTGKNYTIKSGAAVEAETTYSDATYKRLNDSYVSNVLLSSGTNGYAFYQESSYVSGHKGHPDIVLENAIIAGFQVLNSSVNSIADYTAQFKNSDNNDAATTKITNFSAGAGYGYLITDGSIVSWGDYSLGQNSLTGSAVQVVAGKIVTGKPVLESFGKNAIDSQDNVLLDSAVPDFDKWNDDALVDDFTDDSTYISALLTGDGVVKAVGAYNGDVNSANIISTPQSIDFSKYGVGTGNNKIVLLAGGYGDYLFALSSYGKIFRIGFNDAKAGFEIKAMYDEFYTSDGELITNWDLHKDANVTFKTGYYEANAAAEAGKEPEKAVVSFDTVKRIEYVTTPQPEARAAQANTLTEAKTYGGESVLNTNYAGDAYRLIIPKFAAGVTITSGMFTVPSSVTGDNSVKVLNGEYQGTATSFPLKFYWSNDTLKKHELAPELALRYVNIKYRYFADTGIDFVIKPMRSTGAQSLIIDFPVGRYDTSANYSLVARGSPIFYDVQYTSVAVKIENTKLTPEFTTATQTNVDGSDDTVTLPTIPLLDPNNPENNTYSLALMDVSTGLKEIYTALFNFASKNSDITLNTSGSTVEDGLTWLISEIAKKDSGFPAQAKIKAGNLLYYNQYAAKYYDNKYRFMASDIDGDKLTLENVNNVHSNSLTSGTVSENGVEIYRYAPVTKTLELPFTFDASISQDDKTAILSSLKDLFEATDNNVGVSQFDNKYGIDITVTDKGLTLQYTVFTITALRSMSSSYIGYNADNDVNAPELKLATDHSSDNKLNMLRPALYDGKYTQNGQKATTTLTNTADMHRALELFTQSSLTFRKDKVDNKYVHGITPESGFSGDGSNTLNINLGNLTVSVNRTFTFDLSTYFNDTSNIEIGYNGKVGDDAINKLIASFNGTEAGTAGPIELSATSTSITGNLRRAGKYEFYLDIRRVLPTGDDKTFSYNDKPAESATIHFTVNFTFGEYENGNFKVKTNPTNPARVSSEGGFDFKTNRLSITDNILQLCEVEVVSSDTDILRVSWSKEEYNKIKLTPVTSGTAYVRYRVKLYGEEEYTITDSFPVNVVMLVTAPSVNVRGTVCVQLSTLTNALVKAGITQSLTVDKQNSPYHQRGVLKPGVTNPVDDNDYEWTTYEDYKWDVSDEGVDRIPFIRRTFVDEQNTYIGLVMGSFNSTSDDTAVYRIVTEFTDADGVKYQVAFHVYPSEQKLYDTQTNQPLSIEINKKAGTIALTSRDNGETPFLTANSGKYAVSVKLFTEFMNGYSDENTYSILTAQAMSADGAQDYGEYVEVLSETNSSEFYLIPHYPTLHSETNDANIRVALRSVNNKGEEEVVILNFSLTITGIDTVLTDSQAKTVILASFFGVLALLVIIFFIRMGIYWKKKADQRRIIKKNQVLIKMREKMHNKTEAVSKEKLVKTKLKMEDPKYAKMFTDMRMQREAQTGISLENNYVANKAERKVKAEKAKKKRGKMSLEELQAELAAKRESVARMQMGDFSAAPEGMVADGVQMGDVPPMSVPVEDVPIEGVPVFDPSVRFDGMTPEQLDEQFRAAMEGDGITFEPIDGNINENN
ncbi:MAG: hypothetical protein HFE36_02490 [Clostridia bacterium]|nr:hypothetical protein [Clostridia bacterium]